MSRSSFHLNVTFNMLENRKACVPGYEDSSGGHLHFKSGTFKTRVVGPESGHFDGAYTYHDSKRQPEFDMESWVDHLAKKMIEDLQSNDMHLLKHVLRNVLTQAKQHCDEHHADIREGLKDD